MESSQKLQWPCMSPLMDQGRSKQRSPRLQQVEKTPGAGLDLGSLRDCFPLGRPLPVWRQPYNMARMLRLILSPTSDCVQVLQCLTLTSAPEKHGWWRDSAGDREAGEQEPLTQSSGLLSDPPRVLQPCSPKLQASQLFLLSAFSWNSYSLPATHRFLFFAWQALAELLCFVIFSWTAYKHMYVT